MAEKKIKILRLLKVLREETDKNHILDATQLGERLECNRKTIYSDIETLREFGIPIQQQRGSHPGYFIDEREFELPELKLLVDAVQSSKFITTKRSEELIGKLERLTTHENAQKLRRQVFIYNRIKTENQSIYDNVDLIHQAIGENRQITFRYCEWTIKKTLVPRHDGRTYQVSPWSLTWDDENYYLVGFDEGDHKIKHFRVDKMQNMMLAKESRNGRESFEHFDLPSFSRKTFGMYGGDDVKLTISGNEKLVGVVIDRFGTDTMIRPDYDSKEEKRFRAFITVALSPQFYGWMTGIGSGLRIESPAWVQKEYKEYLENILKVYPETMPKE